MNEVPKTRIAMRGDANIEWQSEHRRPILGGGLRHAVDLKVLFKVADELSRVKDNVKR
jgi:hypothetical protein